MGTLLLQELQGREAGEAHRDQLKALGGSAWVRKMLDAVRGIEKKD